MNLRFAIIFPCKLFASYWISIIFINCLFPLLCLFFIFSGTLLLDSPILRFFIISFPNRFEYFPQMLIVITPITSNHVQQEKTTTHPKLMRKRVQIRLLISNNISKWNLHSMYSSYVIFYFFAWKLDVFIASENWFMRPSQALTSYEKWWKCTLLRPPFVIVDEL